MGRHLVIVEAYQGASEYLTDEPKERALAEGLGLPVEDIAKRLRCRITVLCWDNWYKLEEGEIRLAYPATRPLEYSSYPSDRVFEVGNVLRAPIQAKDPDFGLPFSEKGLSPRSHGLINDGGLLSFLSYCLSRELRSLFAMDPFDGLVLPCWGGLGYVVQMEKATGIPGCLTVPCVVVAGDLSIELQRSNQEGFWSRQALILRQMEDTSLALADLVLAFGPRGEAAARAGRLPEAAPPVFVPRRVPKSLLEEIKRVSMPGPAGAGEKRFFLYEPQQPASGALCVLDALTLLRGKGVRLERAFISSGPKMIFAPMEPRDFQEYWSLKGCVRELVNERQLEWHRDYPELGCDYPIRLYPSFFEFLPDIFSELARGSLVLVSSAAAEGLAPEERLPEEILLGADPLPEKVADCIEFLAGSDTGALEKIRCDLCSAVAKAHGEKKRERLLTGAIEALDRLLSSSSSGHDLSRIGLLFLDRRKSLQELSQSESPGRAAARFSGNKTLSVVVTCHEMGAMVEEAVQSIWASEHMPEEVLLVDDGSEGEDTRLAIGRLKDSALGTGRPLKVIRQRNSGLAAARNTGLREARGELISFLDGDDIIEPPFYRIALRLMERYPHLGGIAAWATLFGPQVPDGFWNAPQPEFPFLFVENSVIVPFLTRARLLRDLGGYDKRQRYNYEDWELAIRILASGRPIITVPMHLLRYRVRSDSLYRTMTSVQNQVMRELMFETHRELVAKFAVEIAMQLENQWKRLAVLDSDRRIQNNTFNAKQNTMLEPECRGTLFRTAKSLVKVVVKRLSPKRYGGASS